MTFAFKGVHRVAVILNTKIITIKEQGEFFEESLPAVLDVQFFCMM